MGDSINISLWMLGATLLLSSRKPPNSYTSDFDFYCYVERAAQTLSDFNLVHNMISI